MVNHIQKELSWQSLLRSEVGIIVFSSLDRSSSSPVCCTRAWYRTCLIRLSSYFHPWRKQTTPLIRYDIYTRACSVQFTSLSGRKVCTVVGYWRGGMGRGVRDSWPLVPLSSTHASISPRLAKPITSLVLRQNKIILNLGGFIVQYMNESLISNSIKLTYSLRLFADQHTFQTHQPQHKGFPFANLVTW